MRIVRPSLAALPSVGASARDSPQHLVVFLLTGNPGGRTFEEAGRQHFIPNGREHPVVSRRGDAADFGPEGRPVNPDLQSSLGRGAVTVCRGWVRPLACPLEVQRAKHHRGESMEPHSPLHSDETRGRAIRGRAGAGAPKAAEVPTATPARGLHFERYYTTPGVDPFDTVEWELRNAVISNEKGEKVFEQKDVEMPKFWSQTATNVVVSKYFRGHLGSPDRERSVRQLIGRVADTVAGWGRDGRLLRHRGGRPDLPRRAQAHPPLPVRLLQLAGLVQRRHRGEAPVLGLLHQRAPRTPWTPSSPSPRPRACSSSTAPAPAATSPSSAPRASRWPAAAPPPVRSPS